MAKKRQTRTLAPKAPKDAQVEAAYALAKERYAELGVDADKAVRAALRIPISVQCWQADDVAGLEVHEGSLDAGGIQATGNYPGAARTGDEIRQDFDFAAGLIPGELRFNIHAMYAETGGRVVDRDELEPTHFARWIDWCKERGYGLDFNPTFFAHPLVKNGLTLSSPDAKVRRFWIDHGRVSRRIADAIGAALGPCVNNIWIPDGFKDCAVDRAGARARLVESLDAILKPKRRRVVDAVESKLFGIGCEDATVGSHEFYMGYAVSRQVCLCFDMGHFHPTESIADKISAALLFLPNLLIHASRGVRWDSDHVVRFTDELKAVTEEAARCRGMNRIFWALDFFDASINRVAAWVVGTRSLRKALLWALLEPAAALRAAERDAQGAAKLTLVEHRAELPFAAVWDYACLTAGAGVGASWLADVEKYEAKVLAQRG